MTGAGDGEELADFVAWLRRERPLPEAEVKCSGVTLFRAPGESVEDFSALCERFAAGMAQLAVSDPAAWKAQFMNKPRP